MGGSSDLENEDSCNQQKVEDRGDAVSTLTTSQVLVPPLKSIGNGSMALHFDSNSPAWQCCFSRDGEWLAACFGAPDPCIRLWKREKKITGHGGQRSLPGNSECNSEWVINATLDGVHTRTIRSVAFAPIQSPLILAAASFDHTVSIWEYVDKIGEWECVSANRL